MGDSGGADRGVRMIRVAEEWSGREGRWVVDGSSWSRGWTGLYSGFAGSGRFWLAAGWMVGAGWVVLA